MEIGIQPMTGREAWITRNIDNYNSSMYYENPSYLFESYKAGMVLA